MVFEISSINLISKNFTSAADFWLNLHVDIAQTGGKGAETIIVNVISIERLKMICLDEAVIGRGKIIVTEYDEKEIKKLVTSLINGLKAKTWEELFSLLGNILILQRSLF